MRGKFKAKHGGKRGNKGKKQEKFKSNRKTYSLYSSKNTTTPAKKRKHFNENYESELIKRHKNDPLEEPKRMESSSSEDEEEVDDMQQLLHTFSGSHVGVVANSDSDSDEEPESGAAEEVDVESDVSDMSNMEEHLQQDDAQEENADDVLGSTKECEEEDLDENIDEETRGKIEVNFEEVIQVANEELDPFHQRVSYELNASLLHSLENISISATNHEESWNELGKLHIRIPICKEDPLEHSETVSITQTKIYAPGGKVPQKMSSRSTLKDIFIKSQIINNIKDANKGIEGVSEHLPLSQLQLEMFSILNNYQDFFYPQRTISNAEEIRFAYCLHAINHIMKTRFKVIHHNARLAKRDDVPEEFRDQGLVRPKVMIVLPFRDAAYRTVCTLINILFDADKGNVMNRKRFEEEFTGGELIMPKKKPKPVDYEQLFAGNANDDFKIGLSLTKKTLKLYADFYSSDMIIASPLGLRPLIGADGETDRDYDFLASIELLILDQTDVFLMQNWDHLLHIFKHMHLQPKQSHGTDFSRVRTWSLNGWAKYYRQTLILSSVQLPEINSIFNKHCCNYAGKIKVANPITFGCIRHVYVQLPHVYHKFPAATSGSAIEDRFQFFINKILPQQKDALLKQTLIYVANYFDYVRLRNYLKKEDIGFVQICEYSKDAKIARARDMFFHGDAHFLLYTERYHFFNRKQIKGIRNLIFYQLPNFPHFYYEMCNLMLEGNMNKKVGSPSNMTISVLYSKYDIQQLSAIVGTERALKMTQSDRSVHMLLTDN